DTGEVEDLSAPLEASERDLLKLKGVNDPPGGPTGMAKGRGITSKMAVYWHGGYADPQTFDPERARMIADWAEARPQRILEWAKSSEDPKLRVSAQVCELSIPQSLLDPDHAEKPERVEEP